MSPLTRAFPRRCILALSILAHFSAAHAQDPLPEPEAPIPAADVDPDSTTLEGVRVEGTATTGAEALYLDEKRVSAVVTEALSAEQISRTGDSDAATTLKRVPGLSLVDGRYVYVRGLGERYSSVLLNGAQIPSPDFTRRVVPLDLFPTELLDGIIVQKSYSPDMPGEFGGGTVLLRTREVPRGPIFRVQGTLGYADGTTFEDGLSYRGGDQDWTGYDDGARELPGSLAAAIANGTYLRPQSVTNPGGATPEQLQTYGRDLAGNGFGTREKNIGPETGFAIALGNGYEIAEDVRFGIVGSFRYNQDWDIREEKRNTYSASNAGLSLTDSEEVQSTLRSIDASAFVAMGLQVGMNHRIGLNLMKLRQTEDRTRIRDGLFDSTESRFYELRWVENELDAQQLVGRHEFPGLANIALDWQYTAAEASREEPGRRIYRYDYSGNTLEYSRRSDGNAITYANLIDDQDDSSIKATLPIDFDNGSSLTLSAGGARTTRDRDSDTRTFAYELAPGSPLVSIPGFLARPIDEILAPENVSPGNFVLRETTRRTENYFAEQTLTAGFVNADLNLGTWRFNAGARRESNDRTVTTFDIGSSSFPPVIARDDSDTWLPAAGITWAYSENAQLRLGFGRTLSRPDFRELSQAPYLDPDLDIDTIGNPDLRTTRIRNLDLRWEYYFNSIDSVSVALFDKEFVDPIEKLRLPGSTPLLQLANAQSARNYGIELDAQKNLGFISERWFPNTPLDNFQIGFNYSKIESDIELDAENASFQTNLSRPMQGQSPYVVNVQLGYIGERHEANLLFNRFGRRISEVGVQGQPDIYEEPFGSLDFLWRTSLAEDWRVTFRLRNLLDPEVQFTQGGLDTRTFKRGREALVSLEWRPAR